MISWKAVGLGLACQFLLQAVLFFGVPLLGPAFMLDWTALLTWTLGPFVAGIACRLVQRGRAWICGLIAGGFGTTVFVSVVMLRGDWWLIGAAIAVGSLLGAAGALLGRDELGG